MDGLILLSVPLTRFLKDDFSEHCSVHMVVSHTYSVYYCKL
jgi:hypothetical protein